MNDRKGLRSRCAAVAAVTAGARFSNSQPNPSDGGVPVSNRVVDDSAVAERKDNKRRSVSDARRISLNSLKRRRKAVKNLGDAKSRSLVMHLAPGDVAVVKI